jgi:hypothetical protein
LPPILWDVRILLCLGAGVAGIALAACGIDSGGLDTSSDDAGPDATSGSDGASSGRDVWTGPGAEGSADAAWAPESNAQDDGMPEAMTDAGADVEGEAGEDAALDAGNASDGGDGGDAGAMVPDAAPCTQSNTSCGAPGACVDCSHQGDDKVCVGGGCGCMGPADCAPGEQCDTTTNLCAPSCGPNTPCDSGCCNMNVCVTDCSNSALGHRCSAPITPAGTRLCSCLSDTDCGDGGMCGPRYQCM